MTAIAGVPLLLLATQATFLFSLGGAPVGVVQLRQEGSAYEYRSIQWFTRGADRSRRERSARYTLRDGPMPESLAMLAAPARVGCSEVFEELGTRRGPYCVERIDGADVTGTVVGTSYRAHYEQGALTSVVLGTARFRRVAEVPRIDAPDLFGQGILIDGQRGRLFIPGQLPLSSSALPEAVRALAAKVHDSFRVRSESTADLQPSPEGDVGSCVAHARRFLEWAKRQGLDSVLVFGVVAEPGADRALPHAWARVTTREGRVDVDPTLMIAVTPRTHAALTTDEVEAGQRFLDLFAGALKVTRR